MYQTSDNRLSSDESMSDVEEYEDNTMEYAPGPALPSRSNTARQHSNNHHKHPGKSEMFNASQKQIEDFLSQFYLIRTPYSYILGRNNPAVSTRSLARRSTPSTSQYRPSYGKCQNILLLILCGVSITCQSNPKSRPSKDYYILCKIFMLLGHSFIKIEAKKLRKQLRLLNFFLDICM